MKIVDDVLNNETVKKTVENAKKTSAKLTKAGAAVKKTSTTIGKKVVDSTKTLAAMGKLKVQVERLKKQVTNTKLLIADLVLEKGLPATKTNTKLVEAVDKVAKLNEQIASKNTEMANLKKALKK